MYKSFKLAALAGALSMTMGGAAMAANLQYGGWVATNGTIDMSSSICGTANFSCAEVAVGLGFTQVQVDLTQAGRDAGATVTGLADGESYVMTVVTDQTASGTGGAGTLGFEDVSFIKMRLSLGVENVDNNVNGISARQNILETVGTSGQAGFTQFKSDTTINTGWAEVPGTTPISISQSIEDDGFRAGTGDDFTTAFNFSQERDANGVRSGFTMAIDQTAGLESAAAASVNDVQVFALRQREGSMLDGSGGVVLGGNTGGAVNWDSGNVGAGDTNDIKAIWLGQTINLGQAASVIGALGSSFGYLAFDKTGDTDANGAQIAPVSQFGFSQADSAGAWVWDEAFNVDGTGTPNICDPSGVTVCP